MNIIKDKTKVHELLAIPGTWTTGTLFRNSLKQPCLWFEATCACVYGMIRLCYSDHAPIANLLEDTVGCPMERPLYSRGSSESLQRLKYLGEDL